jgi:hypothetical protein
MHQHDRVGRGVGEDLAGDLRRRRAPPAERVDRPEHIVGVASGGQVGEDRSIVVAVGRPEVGVEGDPGLLALVPYTLLAANPFTDLNAGGIHNANIDAIYNAGITTGCVPNQQYCPNDLVTREQMASFLARTAGLGGNPPVANAKTALIAANATNAVHARPRHMIRALADIR